MTFDTTRRERFTCRLYQNRDPRNSQRVCQALRVPANTFAASQNTPNNNVTQRHQVGTRDMIDPASVLIEVFSFSWFVLFRFLVPLDQTMDFSCAIHSSRTMPSC